MRQLVLVLAFTLAAAGAAAQQPVLRTVELGAGMHLIRAELADRDATRALGLMHRTSLPPNGGMLFVFEQPAVQCFWMRNTLLPLSIAFLADDGTVVNIDDMKPMTENSHCSQKPVRYVLEMNQGWFARKGVKAGSKLQGGPFGSP